MKNIAVPKSDHPAGIYVALDHGEDTECETIQSRKIHNHQKRTIIPELPDQFSLIIHPVEPDTLFLEMELQAGQGIRWTGDEKNFPLLHDGIDPQLLICRRNRISNH